MALRVSITPAVADEEDHSAKSSESQTLPPPVVSASTCRTSLEAADGRTSATYFIRAPCESEPIIETMLVTDKSMGKKPRRNQKASSAARFVTLALAAPRRVIRTNSRQLNPAGLRTAAILLSLCLVLARPETLQFVRRALYTSTKSWPRVLFASRARSKRC